MALYGLGMMYFATLLFINPFTTYLFTTFWILSAIEGVTLSSTF